jgi:Tetratricopeptide repeat
MLETILKHKERNLGSDHPDTLPFRNNLAHAYLDAGRIDDGIKMYEVTLNLCESALGADNPRTLTCRNNFGSSGSSVREFDIATSRCVRTGR